MFKRKQTRAIQKFIYSVFKQFWQLTRTASRKLSRWLVRNLLHKGHKGPRYAGSKAGFVLPTVTLLLIIVSLVIAALLLRTGSRTAQVIGAREEQIIYNAATPAIERAKAKLEYLFQQDTRRPTGAASDQLLLSLLLNDENQSYPNLTTPLLLNGRDPYTLPDENINGRRRLDINGDGKPDPAWAYKIDVDGDAPPGNLNHPNVETVVYGIFLRSRSDDGTVSIDGIGGRKADGTPVDGQPDTDLRKSLALVTRNGPINTINLNDRVCASATQPNTAPPAGQILPVDESVWYPAGSGVLRKTFQIDAIVISNKGGTSRTVATLEFQQDRQLDRANRWGVWYRYDLEIYPGVPFNWNGAMYSSGNLFIGSSGLFRAYLISAEKSCFYGKDSSEITVLKEPSDGGFQGQMLAGKVFTNETGFDARFDLQGRGGNDAAPDINANTNKLDSSNDSVRGRKQPSNIAIDPVILFTQDLSQALGGNSNNREARHPDWDISSIFEKRTTVGRGRIGNAEQNPPYVDDTYRADNRYGPKPKYDRVNTRYWLDNSSKRNGAPIPTTETKLLDNTSNPVSDPEFRALGLDGYWERRAWANGLRIIVSPRLELGNAFGWGGNSDPLYPVNQNSTHEQQQRRTLRDNLAAVQATVVYHHDSGLDNVAGDFPIACLATTVHPGTQQTDLTSRNFTFDPNFAYTDQNNQNRRLISNFFAGKGTNGWEYTVHTQAQYSNNGSLRTALQNLANFAGDPEGAFPPLQQNGQVNPDPYLTMWGNFSNLRRALLTPYSQLSIADKSYLHSAGCVVGMVANNVDHFESYNYPVADYPAGTTAPVVNTLLTAIRTGGGTVITPPTPPNTPADETNYQNQLNTYLQQLSNKISSRLPDEYIRDLRTGNDPQLPVALRTNQKLQIERDRLFGFANTPQGYQNDTGKEYEVAFTSSIPNDPFNPLAKDKTYNKLPGGATPDILLPCDPAQFNYFGLGRAPADWVEERRMLALATTMCPRAPKYPSLYYIFPKNNRNNRQTNDATINGNEPYIVRTNGVQIDGGQFTTLTSAQIQEIALTPKGDGNWTGGNNFNNGNGNWYLPTDSSANPSGETDFRIVTPNGGTRYVSIIDSAFFDSREMMTVRALNVDLNLLRRNNIGNNNNTWLPKSGIVYAFREDAVREDAIARPANGNNPNNNTDPNNPRDPAVATNGISAKAVDFYPDPDRRPYGFRLRNGQDIRRMPGGSVDNNNPRGLTFVSDNPVYIQGDFNYHSTDGTVNNLLEEFTQQLDPNNWDGTFYNRTTLEPRFARIGDGKDTWRPSEILSDAITFLSNSFVEGYADLGIINSQSPDTRYSFRAMNRPDNPNIARGWVLEDGTLRSNNNNALPIKVSRNGNPMYCPNSATVNPTTGICSAPVELSNNIYQTFIADHRGDVNQASQTRVNAIVVSGIVPSRQNQGNGGFHNFPRGIENWNGTNLFITGSFIQLNFSTYGTGPYNQSAWEPGSNPNGNAPAWYYQPPNRVWGYDVGLQYAPAGPLSQRFVTSGVPRSEFYRDLKVDDPYICRLRRALYDITGGTTDPASQRECPTS